MCFPEPHADSAPCWLLSVNPFNGWVYLLLCRCSNLTTEALEADVTSQHDDDSVRKLLSLPPSSGGDVTAECIASNHMGAVSKVFHHRMLPENTTVAYFQSHIWADVKKTKYAFYVLQEGVILLSCPLWLELWALRPSCSCFYWLSSTSGDRFESNNTLYNDISYPNEKDQIHENSGNGRLLLANIMMHFRARLSLPHPAPRL